MQLTKLRIHQNTTFRALAALSDPEGQPLSGDGWKVWCQVRTAVDAPLVAAMKVDPHPKGFMFSLTAKQTSAIQPGFFLFDVLGVGPDGDTVLLCEGELEVVGTITELT